ncbi:MAG: hypothetical protein PHR29_05900 [Acholeplasmataceae bacterium]|nr:hypothetical protein [Acholeplasmataceae bacterium]
MALSYGTEGIKQKNWVLWLFKQSVVAESMYRDFVNYYDINAFEDIFNDSPEQIIGHLGELRNDSVSLTAENGDTVEGNIVGEIAINKVCALNAELINATIENCNELAEYDGLPVIAVMFDAENVDSRFVPNNGATCIVVEGVTLNYNEVVTGGDIVRATISLSKNPSRIDDFRKIFKAVG